MSKMIRIDEKYKKDTLTEFVKMLETMKISDGRINFSKSFASYTRKAKLNFTIEAWEKMKALISKFDTEVAWHGFAERVGEDEKDEYLIKDIVVYPQIVTGAHVDTDQDKYEKWLFTISDEDFPHMRMQGHSHVNMAVSPSSTDIQNQNELLAQLRDDDFYIFMIWNKSGKSEISIYDLKKNILFENSDISVGFYTPDLDLDAFVKGAQAIVAEKKYTPPPASGTYNGSSAAALTSGTKKGKPRVSPTKISNAFDEKKNKGSMYDDDDYDEVFDYGGRWYEDNYGHVHYY